MNDKVQNDKQGSNVEIIRHRYLVIDRIAYVLMKIYKRVIVNRYRVKLWKKWLTLMKFRIPSYVYILLKHMVMLSECYQYVLWIINFYQNYQYVLSILRHIHVFVLFHSWVSVWVHFKKEFIGYDLQTCHTYLVS